MTVIYCRFMLILAISLSMLSAATAAGTSADSPVKLPYDKDLPVIYDNDFTNDYVDWYLMSLASAGEIQYKGISTSTSIAPYNPHVPTIDFDELVAQRAKIVATGRASGLRNVPDPVAGTRGHLVKPESGKIDDTKPIDSAGSRQIIREAKLASAERPLVVIVGGPLTAVADAYLLDPSIADTMVVAFLDNFRDGIYGYNGWSDGWAAYIALERLRLVQFTVDSHSSASVPKDRLRKELSREPARSFILALEPDVAAPEGDCDGPPAIALMRKDYVLETNRVSFGGWKVKDDGHEVPMFKDDPQSRVIVATKVDAKIATEEFWRALTNPAAWHKADTENGAQ